VVSEEYEERLQGASQKGAGFDRNEGLLQGGQCGQ